jgi:hypothetical protein
VDDGRSKNCMRRPRPGVVDVRVDENATHRERAQA